jgi:CRISPR-associated protein Cmr5
MSERTMIEAVENGRAAFAFEQAKSFISANRSNTEAKKEFRSYIKKMPTMIQVNGLGQTLAFYYSKGKTYTAIYQIVDAWVRDHSQVKQVFAADNLSRNQEFVEAIVKLSSREYKYVTMEVLALLNWLRRFADGMTKDTN